MKPSAHDLDAVCRLADEVCGIQWDESKGYLIESRLKRLLDRHACASYADLVQAARANDQVRGEFVDAITTRETLFFRDESPFHALESKILPELIRGKADSLNPKRLRIWSAACSSGQEAYSIAITLMRTIPDLPNWDARIIGTDISQSALQQARRGCYSEFEVARGLDLEYRNRYFRPEAGLWSVRDDVRQLVQFEQRNLLDPFAGLGPFDLILCRNVAIYFDLDVKRDLFERLSRALTSEGVILVGASESLTGYGSRWIPSRHGRTVYYQPNLKAAVSASH